MKVDLYIGLSDIRAYKAGFIVSAGTVPYPTLAAIPGSVLIRVNPMNIVWCGNIRDSGAVVMIRKATFVEKVKYFWGRKKYARTIGGPNKEENRKG